MSGFEVVRQVFGVFAWLLGRLVGVVVGPMTWRPPAWSRWVGARSRAIAADARRRPARAAIVAAGVLAVVVGGGYGIRWWNARPRPIEIAVTVTAPPATPIDERARPLPAVVSFSESVAPLSALGKAVTTGIELSPKLDGAWRWRSDHELEFQPAKDWPVGQRYAVRLAKRGLVAERARLDSYSVEFDTAAFTAEVSEKEFYQDPVDAGMKKVVVTFSFSHPVDTASFEKALRLTLVPGTTQEKELRYKAEVTYDKLRGKAFVHSAPVEVPQRDATMRIELDKGVRARAGGRPTEHDGLVEVHVPGLYNFLKVASTQAQVVDNAKNEPEQVIVVETSAGVSEPEMRRSIEAWVLPVYDPSDADEQKRKHAHRWNDPERVDPELLKKGQRLTLDPIAQEQEYSTLHSFRYKAEVGRYVYLHVKKGMRAFGGYLLGEPALSIVRVPPFPRQLRILHSGSLLSMAGEHKVSLFARDVAAVRIEIARVLPDQLQHVVTQAGGEYGHPQFSYRFDLDNAAERFTEDKDLGKPGAGKPVYEAIDLGGYLGTGEGRRGIFVLKVHALDPDRKTLLDEEDSRLIVVSDLGILAKVSEDGGRDVFVASIHGGDPVAGAKVQVLGKNGLPIATATTDAEGHARLPSLREFVREKAPVMMIAQKARDTSFLPLNGYDRFLDLSRFDVGGVSSGERPKSLSAYVFSDRGIYRPGEEIRAGVVVRANDWRTSLDGVPIELQIDDARGMTVKKQRVRLPASGLVELRHATPDVAPTGTYTIGAYLIRDNHVDALLGSTTVRVREFLPDKMKIAVHFSSERPAGDGWVRPEGLSGKVTLTNLYGTPASGRKVRAQLSLSPAIPSFAKLRDYTFYDPMTAKDGASEALTDAETDDKGEVSFELQLQRWKPATYRLSLTAEGFEADAGRGVTAEAQVMVSPMPFLVGYKADGDLSYLSKGSARKVELIAVGPTGERETPPQLRAVLFERKFVSVLTKQPNGTFKYESVRREIELSQKPLHLAKEGTKYALPTDRPGDFTLVVRSEKELDLQKIEFSVAGTANLSRSMEKNAELGLQLKSRDVEPGQEVEMQLKAPYTGTGLITVERDHVYSWKWFKSTTNASVQTVKIPDGLEGGGYVSVSYLRDAGSDEVFASPLSYAVAPFSISRAKRKAQITIDVPELARPGEPLAIKVQADRKVKAIVFAVDEGILRVADYKSPDPLGFFFQKRALGVRTQQILDLVLPEFSRLMAAVAPGGDSEGAIGANLNPFKRRRDPPVAYWSGVFELGPNVKTLTYDVPDTFNGTLRVLAVVAEPEAIGVAERRMIVRGDYVLSPTAPLAVAPGDEFELTTSVANNVDKPGASDDVTVSLAVAGGLTVVGDAKVSLKIARMHEGKTSFRLRATETLGAATATLTASGAGRPAHIRAEMSVRPAVPYTVTFLAGHLREGDKTVTVPRQLYAEHRQLQAGLSRLPLGLTHGLVGYLEKFPHGCTEQITSQAVPAIALGRHAEFGFTNEAADASFHKWIDLVRTRQNDDGAFGLWAASPKAAPLPSVWTLLVLTEAKDRGLLVPDDMLKAGQAYLQGLAARDGDSLGDERLRAMAIYVLTRMGRVTTSYASALKKRLEADFAKTWKTDLAAAYLAGTLALLKQTDKARALIDGVPLGAAQPPEWEYLLDPLARDAQLLYLTARHFPERAAQVTPAQLDKLVEPIFQGSYNTYSSAFAILALETYGRVAQKADADQGALSITEVLASGKRPLALPASLLPVASFAPEATALSFAAKGGLGAYWLLEQKGFDRQVPDAPLAQKIEVFREYTDEAGKPVDKVALGDEVFVRVRLRGLDPAIAYNSIAIVDLLPGGFEAVLQERRRASGPDEGNGEEPAARGDTEAGEGGDADEVARNRGGGDDDTGGDDTIHGVDAVVADASAALPIALDGSTMFLTYGDVREDRVVLYTFAEKQVAELVYKLKATNVGTYRTAPILADSMYDRSVLSRGRGGRIAVYRK